jgi:hypothetical protein
MLPGFRQLPESAVKDWHGPEDEEPRYVKGMKAAARAHSAKAGLQGVRAAMRGYAVGVVATVVAYSAVLPGLLLGGGGWWLVGLVGFGVLVLATQKVVGAFFTFRKEEREASAEATKINAEVERNIRVLPETEEAAGLPGEKAA